MDGITKENNDKYLMSKKFDKHSYPIYYLNIFHSFKDKTFKKAKNFWFS